MAEEARLTATVLCVLKAGGEYRPEHAARLYDQLLEHAPQDVEFGCLTDLVEEVDELNVPTIHLEHAWPGWWSKVEAFRILGPVLYLDLDVNLVGDLSPLLEIARDTPFVMAHGFWGVDDPSHVNSSVMAWSGDVSLLYRAFREAPAAHMSIYSTREKWGDQVFVRDHWPGEIAKWQDLLPGKVLSFKRGILVGEKAKDARVICSHGLPRPWSLGGADDWLARRLRQG